MKGHTLVKEQIFGPTCTICGIHTGHTDAGAKTVLPSMAMARLDFRLVPDLTAELVVGLLRDHLDVRGFRDIEIIESGSAPLAKSSAKSRVARPVIEATNEFTENRRLFILWIRRRDQWARCVAYCIRRRRLHLSERAMRDRILMDRMKTSALMIS